MFCRTQDPLYLKFSRYFFYEIRGQTVDRKKASLCQYHPAVYYYLHLHGAGLNIANKLAQIKPQKFLKLEKYTVVFFLVDIQTLRFDPS